MKKKIKWRHISGIFRFFVMLIPALIAKIFIKNLWLIQEDDSEARDNGFYMFKYIRKNHPKQKCYYVIHKKSQDYDKVKKLGKAIEPHSYKHWFYYIIASKNITSQASGKPCPAFVNMMERKGIFKTKTYFLQHGVIYNDLKWLYSDKAKFKLFVTSAQPEYEFVKSKFNHPEGVVKLLGLPRFDGLHEDITEKDMILVMPTWRNYIKSNIRSIIDTAEGVEDQDFLNSTYFRAWNDFINSEKLDKFLTETKKKIYFYPHRNMQPFINNFYTNSTNIIIAKSTNEDVQNLLKKCSMIISDYSSVIFDVLYQYKPVICYQFDEEEFHKGQYSKGYLDFSKTKMIKQKHKLDEVLDELEKLNKNNYKITKECCDEIDKFFPLNDNKNCERVYDEIKKG